jgi:hypothetical protein
VHSDNERWGLPTARAYVSLLFMRSLEGENYRRELGSWEISIQSNSVIIEIVPTLIRWAWGSGKRRRLAAGRISREIDTCTPYGV